MARSPSVVVADQDVQSRYEIRQLVKAAGLTVAAECGFGIQAISSIRESRPDAVLISVSAASDRAWQTIRSVLSLSPETPVIAYSTEGQIAVARTAMLAGARDFLPRPFTQKDLYASVVGALDTSEQRRLGITGNGGRAPTAATTIAVTGAKGGIGKSTLAVNLAASLARRQSGAVALVDLDTGFGDVAGMLNLAPERTLTDLAGRLESVTGHDDLSRYLVRHEASSLDILAAPSVLEWRALKRESVRAVLEKLTVFYDIIVLDTSGLLDEMTEVALELSQAVLWVTTTEFASVSDTMAAMRVLKELGIRLEHVRVVVNAVSPDDFERPDVLRDVMGTNVFWNIPYDRRVRRGAYLGEPVVLAEPKSIVARSFEGLASALAGERTPPPNAAKGRRWRRSLQPVAVRG